MSAIYNKTKSQIFSYSVCKGEFKVVKTKPEANPGIITIAGKTFTEAEIAKLSVDQLISLEKYLDEKSDSKTVVTTNVMNFDFHPGISMNIGDDIIEILKKDEQFKQDLATGKLVLIEEKTVEATKRHGITVDNKTNSPIYDASPYAKGDSRLNVRKDTVNVSEVIHAANVLKAANDSSVYDDSDRVKYDKV